MYVCVSILLYYTVCVYVCLSVLLYYTVCVYVCLSVLPYVYVCIKVFVCLCACACSFVDASVCVCVHTYVHLCVSVMHIHSIHTCIWFILYYFHSTCLSWTASTHCERWSELSCISPLKDYTRPGMKCPRQKRSEKQQNIILQNSL